MFCNGDEFEPNIRRIFWFRGVSSLTLGGSFGFEVFLR